MADDGDSSSGPVDTSGGQGAADESDGLGLGGMLLNISILVLVAAVCLVVYRRWGRRLGSDAAQSDEASRLPKMRRRDFTLEQLREYDGLQNPRILMAVNMKIFDVTSGKKFYGKGECGVGRRLIEPLCELWHIPVYGELSWTKIWAQTVVVSLAKLTLGVCLCPCIWMGC